MKINESSIELKAKIDIAEPMGKETIIHFALDGSEIIARVNPITR